MRVGAMVTNYNQKDWPRLLAGDYQSLPEPSDLEIHTDTMALGEHSLGSEEALKIETRVGGAAG